MNLKYLALPIVAFVLGLFVMSLVPSTVPVSNSEGIHYKGVVCVYKNNELVECKHNILTTLGSNLIKTALGQGANSPITNISVANCTGQFAAADTNLCGGNGDDYDNTFGLGPTTGTYVSAGNGAWNITYQWTATTNSIIVNATGLSNATGSAQLFAEVNFTSVTLQNGDKLNVTWGITVTGT